MPAANPIVTAVNSGVLSPFMYGRVDFRRYAFALKGGTNFFSTPQGVALSSPGTRLYGLSRDQANPSHLTPWVFSDQQLIMLEWAPGKLRFWDNNGAVAETAKSVTAASLGATTIDLTIGTHGWSTGDSIYLDGFEAEKNLNGRIFTGITVVDPNTVRITVTPPATIGSLTSATAARIYELTTPYAAGDLSSIRLLRDLNDTIVYCGEDSGSLVGHPPYLLTRNDTTDWTFVEYDLLDGPYLESQLRAATITPDDTGSPVPTMTADNLPSPYVASSSGAAASRDAYFAFDQDPDTYWQSSTNQTGYVQIQLDGTAVVTGYSIHVNPASTDATYVATDYAPSTWKLQGSNDGSTWTDLDRQANFVAYEKGRTPYISIGNQTAYEYYRLDITAVVRNGALPPRVACLNLGVDNAAITLTASSTAGINGGDGFQTTDVGRLIRVRGDDLFWRALRITARTSTTVVDAVLEGEPFLSVEPCLDFRMGLFSDTTGWPITATRFKGRHLLGGAQSYPSFFAGSEANSLQSMRPTDEDGLVVDDNGFALEITGEQVVDIRWFVPFDKDRGILVGTGAGIYILTRTDATKPLTGVNLDADPAATVKAARARPELVDQAAIFIASNKRNLYEIAYSFQADGFEPRDLSLFASVPGNVRFEQVAYVEQPYPLLLVRRTDGVLAMVTYDRREDVLGWFEYQAGAGAEIESVAVLPDGAADQQLPWLCVKRTVNGSVQRTIERMEPFWRQGMTTADTSFVQMGARYAGAATTTLYGLWALEGEQVVGLADGVPITPQTVTNGSITLPQETTDAVIGLPFDGECETVSLEAGAANGTAQGQSKRVHSVEILVLDSQTGSVGKRRDGELIYEAIDYRTITDVYGALPAPYTGFKRVDGLSGHGVEATVAWKRDGDKPLPFHVVALVPEMETRG